MDYETKILLNKLIEAVDSPDWWTIGITSAITIINAIIMVWLGVNQYKLQQQQNAIQEYEIYRRFYILIKSVYNSADNLLFSIALYLSDNRELEYYDNFWEKERDDIRSISKDIDENEIDLELKLSNYAFNIEDAKSIIGYMLLIVRELEEIVNNDGIITECNPKDISIKECGDEYLIEYIMQRVKEDKAERFRGLITRFAKIKKDFCRKEILLKIKDKCRLTNL